MTNTNTTVEFNRLTAKALLLDAITFKKFKRHLAPNWKQAKDLFCKAYGCKTTISADDLIAKIGEVYKENNLSDDFNATMKRFGL